jgi:aminopeptidase N
LAACVGVFFVGALFTIASYQMYKHTVGGKDGGDPMLHVEVGDVPMMPALLNDVMSDDVTTSTSSSSGSGSGMYDEVKLPHDVVPLSYTLYLRVGIQAKKYTGMVRIQVQAKTNASRIVLHSSKHQLSLVQVRQGNRTIPLDGYSTNSKREMLILRLSEPLVPGQKYDLLAGFNAELDFTYENGIYLSKYKDGEGKERLMVSTDLEPLRARRMCPCFDEPALKATWQLIIQPDDKGFHATSNMPAEKTISLGEGRDETWFKRSPLMSSYLVSVLVSEYQYTSIDSPNYNVKVGIYYPIGRQNEAMKSLDYGTFSVDYFSKLFGISYTSMGFPKLDLFPVSKFSAGADETWGNIVFEETTLLADPKTSDDAHKKQVAKTVAHEIAHMVSIDALL